jgi:hypothetical protein
MFIQYQNEFITDTNLSFIYIFTVFTWMLYPLFMKLYRILYVQESAFIWNVFKPRWLDREGGAKDWINGKLFLDAQQHQSKGLDNTPWFKPKW